MHYVVLHVDAFWVPNVTGLLRWTTPLVNLTCVNLKTEFIHSVNCTWLTVTSNVKLFGERQFDLIVCYLCNEIHTLVGYCELQSVA